MNLDQAASVVQRYQPLLFQPVPSLLGYEFADLVEETRAAFFPSLDTRFEVRVARVGGSPLACIFFGLMGRGEHVIVFHPILNHSETPREVVTLIAKHELTHALMPGADHDDEFWRHEGSVAPERYACWRWIHDNLRPALRRADGRITIHRSWRRLQPTGRGPYTPHLPFEGDPFERLCPEGGAQLRLPPNWALRPATLAAAD